MAPTTADIRKFLTELFSDEELTTLCYDYFRDVYLRFRARHVQRTEDPALDRVLPAAARLSPSS